MRPLRVALAGLAGLVLMASSAPARADWISLGSSDPDNPNGWDWFITILFAGGALAPQIVAGVQVTDKKDQFLDYKAGWGIFAPGLVLTGFDTAFVALSEPPKVTAVVPSLLGGPFWSMTGVGMGAILSSKTAAPERAPWLGGSVGFTSFAVFHAAMSTAGIDDHPPAAVFQSIYAGLGGIGCAVDAGIATGAERWVGIGCAAFAAAALTHGIIKTARGDLTRRGPPAKRRRRAVVPVPWFQRDAAGLALAGTF